MFESEYLPILVAYDIVSIFSQNIACDFILDIKKVVLVHFADTREVHIVNRLNSNYVRSHGSCNSVMHGLNAKKCGTSRSFSLSVPLSFSFLACFATSGNCN